MTRQPEIGQIPDTVKDDIKALEKEFDAAEIQVAKLMAKLHDPILKKRADVVSKIEGFWPQALTNCVSTNVYIDDDDHALLDHLTKIDVVRDPEDPRAAKIEFHFSPNDFIEDKVLVKEFKLAPDAGEFSAQFDFATDTVPVKTPISWKSDAVNLSKLKPTVGDLPADREDEEEDDEVDLEADDFEPGSFFSSFFDSESAQVAGSIGRAIVEDLFPNAVQHFETPALFEDEDEDEDEDEEDEDEEDEEDEDDDDREIDLEEEEATRPKKKARK
ncbi:chromatin binding protein [Malassezia pachydermatis]|uniref:Set protein (Protein phosphatase 2a inhibitor) n=1 Tax=Malassezia pachydermatis TaxID=77020 RepID=A0A0M8MPS4_9BASI|nr:set protein (protein phosphatase 2a inhibitor) [Malassezia pachydermatis]KOS14367.1 set protein (protein phosphatase 2a inhibitor) [Malassezia pachydermatis]